MYNITNKWDILPILYNLLVYTYEYHQAEWDSGFPTNPEKDDPKAIKILRRWIVKLPEQEILRDHIACRSMLCSMRVRGRGPLDKLIQDSMRDLLLWWI